MLLKRSMLIAIICLICTICATDFCFPSPQNPAGLAPESLVQYVTITWNDNYYTGLDGTSYEKDTGSICWCGGHCVGGKEGLKTHGFPAWVPSNNVFNIKEGDIVMAWAMQLGVPMTFNMITGLYVPVSNPKDSPDIDGDGTPDGWANRESPLGYYRPTEKVEFPYTRKAVSWGTEQEIVDGGEKIQPHCYVIATNMAIAQGHEIGNHTIDHMEANSPLPGGPSPFASQGFQRWNDVGYDSTHEDYMPWGEVIDEAAYFNQDSSLWANRSGWKIKAGSYQSRFTWKGAIDIAEEWLFKQTDMTKNKLYGFCAPRMEVSSGLYFALAENRYQYDCSIEEGLEPHRNGSNFLWPYTVDNGSQNSWTQFNKGGEHRYLQDMPVGKGLWEIPVTQLVVPEDIRPSVWDNRVQVQLGEGKSQDEIDEYKIEWLQFGKIRADDINAFIHWGMTDENWLQTMKNSLELRLKGNKAPLHYRAHSDIYGPNYDYDTLLISKYKDSWGLPVIKGWNNWKTRISAMEEWITWSQGKEVTFVTGHQLIEEMKKLTRDAPEPDHIISYTPTFTLYINEDLPVKTVASVDSFTEKADITISIAPPHELEYPFAHYFALAPEKSESIAYISLKYQISKGALVIRLHLEDEPDREILLNNIETTELVNSGLIPISAFDYNQYEVPKNVTYDTPIDMSKLQAISIQPLVPMFKNDGSKELRTEPYEMSFKIEDFVLHGRHTESSDKMIVSPSNKISVIIRDSKTLQLQIAKQGIYSVDLYTVSGRLIYSMKKQLPSAGLHTFPLENVSKGVYLVKVVDDLGNTTLSQKITLR